MLTGWLYLLAAIASEVVGTVALRSAGTGRRTAYALVAVGYVLSFVLLSLSLRRGIGIGVAYGVWTAVGVAAIATLDRLLFGATLGRTRIAGLALIVAGVALVELGAADHIG